jgi:uncharacterized protein YkwD
LLVAEGWIRVRRITAAAAIFALGATLTVGVGAADASAQGLQVGGSGNTYYLNDQFSTIANIEFTFGRDDDEVYFGDWDGDGRDTPMLRRGTTFLYSNANTTGEPSVSFTYGRSSDEVLVGDWDADGRDSIAVRRDAVFHIRNVLSDGSADTVVQYGRTGDTVLVGDWDANGTDTFSVRRGAQYHVRNSMTSGPADVIVQYGREGDLVLVGDWDGDGRDSFAVRRDATYFIANAIRPGEADITVVYGRSNDVAFAGDWNGDRKDTLGVRRVFTAPPPPPPPADPVNCTGDGGANAPGPYTCQQMEAAVPAMLALINEERAARQLPPLRQGPCLTAAAQHWSESMVWLKTSGSAHNPSLTADVRACGVVGWSENVGRTVGSAPDTRVMMDRWMASSGHFRNLMSPTMEYVGIGIASAGDRQWYYVLDFGRL